MDLLCYNRENGQLDAFLRGFYSKLLKKDTYKKFQECERLDDIIACLDDTVYEKYFEDEQKFTDIKSFVIQFKRALAEDYKLFYRYASPLARKFIDYLSYESIIDNIILLLQFSVEERSKPDVINMLDPLGWNNDLELLLHFNGELTELFRIVLFDTPVGPYFERYLELLRDGNSELNFTLDQIDFELMRVCLIRFWLEDYYNFVCSLNSNGAQATTRQYLSDVLKKEADYLLLNVTLNTLHGTNKNDISRREQLFANFGYLYPDITNEARKFHIDSMLPKLLTTYPEYKEAFLAGCAQYQNKKNNNSANYSFEDIMYKNMLNVYDEAFSYQMNFGIFHAYKRIREQESRNILWAAEMVSISSSHFLGINKQ